MMKRISALLFALIAALALSTAVMADEAAFDPQLTLEQSAGQITVTLVSTESNNKILSAKKPTLTVPCERTVASVTGPDGVSLTFAQADGGVCFTVAAGGTYTIALKTTASDNTGGGSSGAKAETTTNPDGSTTKTETKPDGTVVEITTGKDGSTTKTETKPDGSSVTERRDANGTTGTVRTGANGRTEAEAAVSERAVEDAKQSGGAVKVPTEVKAGENSNSAPTVKIELPKEAGETRLEIPVSNVSSGTVAIIVHEDGTEEIVRDSVPTEDGVQLTVSGSATVKIVDNSKDFLDTHDHWSKDEVNLVASRELFNGIGGGLFGVKEPMTRGMVNTVLARLAGVDTTPADGEAWYEIGTEWAKRNGITDGTDPEASITREQLAAMLYRFSGTPEVNGDLSFSDAHEISDYAQNALLWAVQNGIMNGVGSGRIAPSAEAERAQVAAMLARYLKNL